MSWPLNNVTTSDEYTEATTLETGPASRVTLDVYNHAIFVSLLTSPNGERGRAVWQPDLFMAPASKQFIRRGLFGVKVRSAVKGEPAQVTIEVVGRYE